VACGARFVRRDSGLGRGASAVITNVAAARADEDDTVAIVHVDNRSDQIERDAVLALTGLGFTKAESRRAVDSALGESPESLEQLVRAALRRFALH
jgi:Holliday junction resolvasome RuvABC DNA-binding subunit